MAELELTVGAQILVAPARCDLVVTLEAADHEQLLEELWRLRQREETTGLKTDGNEEVARAFGRPEGQRRRPDVDETLFVHRAPDRGDHRVREPEVPLHPLAS